MGRLLGILMSDVSTLIALMVNIVTPMLLGEIQVLILVELIIVLLIAVMVIMIL